MSKSYVEYFKEYKNLIDKQIPKEVIELDSQFENNFDFEEKVDFLKSFEKNSELLPKWIKYKWLLAEVNYLAQQKTKLEQEPEQIDTIDAIIKNCKERNLSLQETIEKITTLSAKIVLTEHPTDPLSEPAREIVTELAKVILSEDLDAISFNNLVVKSQQVDTIPKNKRTVPEEVTRNKKFIDDLYTYYPKLVAEISEKLKSHFPDASNIDDLLHEALLLSPEKLISIFKWPGRDADGNTKMDAEQLVLSDRFDRIYAVEAHCKYIDTELKHSIAEKKKEIRDAINKKIQTLLPLVPEDRKEFYQHINAASGALYEKTDAGLESAILQLKSDFKDEKIVSEIENLASDLVNLKALSHINDTNNNTGLLQHYEESLKSYKKKRREDNDAIKSGSTNPNQHFQEEFLKIYISDAAKKVFEKHPDIKVKFQVFQELLKTFGLTYGVGDVRQDSNVNAAVWQNIVKHVRKMDGATHNYILEAMPKGVYSSWKDSDKYNFHKAISQDTEEAKAIRKYISNLFSKGWFKEFEPTVEKELQRMKAIKDYRDGIGVYIISNTTNEIGYFEVKSLAGIFGIPDLKIVPLIETKKDLENLENIVYPIIRHNILEKVKEVVTDPKEILEYTKLIETGKPEDIKAALNDLAGYGDLEVEFMLGFSDSERVSGVMALLSVAETREKLGNICASFGIRNAIYFGPGGDINRYGLDGIFPGKFTLQGNARNNLLNSTDSTKSFLGKALYRGYVESVKPFKSLSQLSPELQTAWQEVKQAGAEYYENLHDENKGFGKITGFTMGVVLWFVNTANCSSRDTSRPETDESRNKKKFFAYSLRIIDSFLEKFAIWLDRLPDNFVKKMFLYLYKAFEILSIKINKSVLAENIDGFFQAENSNDRFSIFKKGGAENPKYVNPDKPRAISSTQIKEVLRNYNNVIAGIAQGYKIKGAAVTAELYKNSKEHRDIIEKLSVALEQTDFRIIALAFFSNKPEYNPFKKTPAEIEKMAAAFKDKYSSFIAANNFDAVLKNINGNENFYEILSHYVAYLYIEMQESRKFVYEVKKELHPELYKDRKGSLLREYPELEAAVAENNKIRLSVSILAALITNNMIFKNFSEMYTTPKPEDIIGSLIAAEVASRIMSPLHPHATNQLNQNVKNDKLPSDAEIYSPYLGSNIQYTQI